MVIFISTVETAFPHAFRSSSVKKETINHNVEMHTVEGNCWRPVLWDLWQNL